MGSRGLAGYVTRAGREAEQLGAGYRVVLTVAGILAIGALDVATGPQVAFSVFYLVPISLVACAGQRGIAIGSCAVAALTWWAAERLSGGPTPGPSVAAWNVTSRFLVFAVVATLLGTLRGALARAEELSLTDHLTGAANTRRFLEAAELERLRASRSGRPPSVVYIDLDNFKALNDSFGHLAGDELLRRVGEVLMAHVRAADVVGRLGGDEFAVLLPETDQAGAESVAHKLHSALHGVFVGDARTVTASFGVASFNEVPLTSEAMLSAADAQMYEVKARGKDAVLAVTVG